MTFATLGGVIWATSVAERRRVKSPSGPPQVAERGRVTVGDAMSMNKRGSRSKRAIRDTSRAGSTRACH